MSVTPSANDAPEPLREDEERGLTSEQAEALRREHGRNEIPDKEEPFLRRLPRRFRGPIPRMIETARSDVIERLKSKLDTFAPESHPIRQHEPEVIELIESSAGFVQVLPEDKYLFVDRLQKADHIVGTPTACCGVFMAPVGRTCTGHVWAYATIRLVFNRLVKVQAYRILREKKWLLAPRIQGGALA